jgi:hypothetical protein
MSMENLQNITTFLVSVLIGITTVFSGALYIYFGPFFVPPIVGILIILLAVFTLLKRRGPSSFGSKPILISFGLFLLSHAVSWTYIAFLMCISTKVWIAVPKGFHGYIKIVAGSSKMKPNRRPFGTRKSFVYLPVK